MKITVTAANQVLSQDNQTTLLRITAPSLGARQYVYLPFDDFHRRYKPAESSATDLLAVAGIVYTIDQLIPRKSGADGWSRELSVTLPVKDPTLWQEHLGKLERLLCFLTGDQWHLDFKMRRGLLYRGADRHLKQIATPQAKNVALFSGGFDSFVGAVDWLETNSGHLALVGHRDLGSSAGCQQTALHHALAQRYHNRTHLINVRVGPLSSKKDSQGPCGYVCVPDGGESTLRSRSFLFLSLAVFVAEQQPAPSDVVIRMAENGLIALNPSLTPSRAGACSTRTAHPLFVAMFAEFIRDMGLAHVISCPYMEQTKGQMLANCAAPGFVTQHIDATVSCAHPNRRAGWLRRKATHCGYCVPCLYRRAALHRAGLDVGTDYGFDVVAGELSLGEPSAADARALLSWLYNLRSGHVSIGQVIRRMNGQGLGGVDVHALLQAAVEELLGLVRAKGCATVRKWVGV